MPNSSPIQNQPQQPIQAPQVGTNLGTTPPKQASQSAQDMQPAASQAVPPADRQKPKAPKEQSVEEIENELMVGAGPDQKTSGVVAGQGPADDQGPGLTKPQKPKEESIDKVKDEAAVKQKADKANLPYVNLMGFAIAAETLNLIPEDLAKKYKAIPYLKANKHVRVASVDPKNKGMIQKISDILSSEELEPLFSHCSEKSILYALKNYQFAKKPSEEVSDVKVSGKQTSFKKEIKGFIALRNEINKVPTTKLFDVLVSGGVKADASDVHIEPTKNKMKVRYRIDGILQDIVELPKDAYNSLLSRVKFLAKMKLDLKNLPQDGRFTISSEGKNIDLRISTLPTVYGESIVMRLLQQDKGFITLEKLGFNPQAQKLVEEAISRPTGMILNTGPTGSGKTTTLYAILDKLNKPGVKIITLEDPVEYRVSGVIQSMQSILLLKAFGKV